MVAALTTMSRPPNKPTSLQQPARTWAGWVSAHRKTIRNGAANARGTRHNGNLRAKLFHVSFLLSVHDSGFAKPRSAATQCESAEPCSLTQVTYLAPRTRKLTP